jgi:hypothetical protein
LTGSTVTAHRSPSSVVSSGRRSHAAGGVLISVLVFLLITTIIITGLVQLVVSHYMLAVVSSDYNTALGLAEAGIDAELRTISVDQTQADQKGTTSGVTYNYGGGAYRVFCCNLDLSTPWTPGTKLYIYSKGTYNGTSRTLRIAAKPIGGSTAGSYALFGDSEGIINGTATSVTGDLGTNGFFTFNGHPSVPGKVIFNGPTSNWQSPPNGTYNVVHNPATKSWQTVTQIADAQFGANGLTWVKTHNDNALAVPAVPANYTVLLNGNGSMTFKGKTGGANYYVESLTTNGNAQIAFDNTAGPITIWVGPAGNASTFIFNGGASAIKMSQDVTKAVRIYIATTNDIIQNGNGELDALLYNINGYGNGRFIMNGTPNFYGQAIVNKFTLNGNPTIAYQNGYFGAATPTYYSFDNLWQEL